MAARAETADPGGKKPPAGAPLEWLKEWSAALLIIGTIVGGVVVLRDDIRDRPTLGEVNGVIQKAITVHALIPHPGAQEATNARILKLEKEIEDVDRAFETFKAARERRILRGGGTRRRSHGR